MDLKQILNLDPNAECKHIFGDAAILIFSALDENGARPRHSEAMVHKNKGNHITFVFAIAEQAATSISISPVHLQHIWVDLKRTKLIVTDIDTHRSYIERKMQHGIATDYETVPLTAPQATISKMLHIAQRVDVVLERVLG